MRFPLHLLRILAVAAALGLLPAARPAMAWKIPVADFPPGFSIPDAAIVSDQNQKLVMTVTTDGTVVPKVIRPGPSYGNLRIVRSGLSAGDTIVIDGLVRVRPGSKVTPEPGKIALDEPSE